MYALVDANSYYCSAEQVFRPDWRGRPVVVLSNNDGCAVAVNRQARELGIPKFKPYFEIKPLCDFHKVIVLSSNYELYADLSSKMMEVIGRHAPEQYIYSIDETFLSFKRCFPAIQDLAHHGAKIRKAVWKECRLPVCVGMAETLTLSKVANHAAKKLPDYNGVCIIDSDLKRIDILSKLQANDVWGIGRRISERLKHMGINTALELAQYSPDKARRDFNVEVERTIRELNGMPCKSWDGPKVSKKQIYSTRSVGERITTKEALCQALSKHAGIASRKARNQGSLCRVMLCFASNSPFDDAPVSKRGVHQFAYPTSDATQITKVATQMANELFREGVRYYKIGVGLIELVDGTHEQRDLFDPAPNNSRLMGVFDSINSRYGTDTVFLGAQGINQRWSMRRDRLTPQYTTNWNHIPQIKC
ncbi:Y-family DNA polymerase [Vibrio owensii]|uniref:Y-family DNA polymerase n=1 Tax=Vibrio owensii TaxID=696485 RepID=UPI003CC63D12